MASDNEACCESDPNFAVICGFLEKFGVTCGLANIDFLDLQDMLENSQEVPQELVDLHVKLLRKARKSVSSERWERAIIKLCHGFCSQDAWEIERFGYKKARLSSKLRILKELLEMQFDYNAKFKNEINKLSAEELRTQPLGKDRIGHVYWFQSDNSCQIRVYKEDPDEETWSLVAKDREGLVTLITQLNDGQVTVLNEDSNSLESEKPVVDTGQTDSNSNSNSQDQTSTDTNPEENQVDITKKEESDFEKSQLDEEDDTQNNLEVAKLSKMKLKTNKVPISDDTSKVSESLGNGNGEGLVEQELKSEPNSEKEEKDKCLSTTLSPPKTGISIRIKPISELISSTAVDVNKKPEITGVKEKYIRSDSSSSSSVHHRKAVDSAGFDVHTNYLKRPIEEEEDVQEPSYIKRPRLDRPTLLGNKKKKPYSDEEDEEEEVSDEVEEPLMLVTGEGSGQDNEGGNSKFTETGSPIPEDDSPIVGEEIVESVVYFYGEGSGHACETGNESSPNKQNVSTQQENITQSTTPNADATSDPNLQHTSHESDKADTIDSIKQNEPSSNNDETDCSVKTPTKSEFKLGTIIDVRTNKLMASARDPAKKSRWDVGKPGEAVSNESQISTNPLVEEASENASVQCNSNSDTKLELKDDQCEEQKIELQVTLSNASKSSKGKVQQLVNQWEKLSKSNPVCDDNNENLETTTADETSDSSVPGTPKKSMFFFGPGCLQVKPTISPIKSGTSESFGKHSEQQVPTTSAIEDDEKIHEVPNLQSVTQIEDRLNPSFNLDLKTGSYEVTGKTEKLLASNEDFPLSEKKLEELKDNDLKETFKKPQAQKSLRNADSQRKIEIKIDVPKCEASKSQKNESEKILKNIGNQKSTPTASEKHIDCGESKLTSLQESESIADNNILLVKESYKHIEQESIKCNTSDSSNSSKLMETAKVKEVPVSTVTEIHKTAKHNEEKVASDPKICDNLKLSGVQEEFPVTHSEISTSTIFTLENAKKEDEVDNICNLPNNIVTDNHHVPKNSVNKKELEKIDSSSSSIGDDQKSNKLSDVPVSEKSHILTVSGSVQSEKSGLVSPKVAGLPVAEEQVENANTSALDNKPKSKLEDVQEDIKKVNIQKTDSIDLSVENKDSGSKLELNATTSKEPCSIEMQMAMIMGENLSDTLDVHAQTVSNAKISVSSNRSTPPPIEVKCFPDPKNMVKNPISSIKQIISKTTDSVSHSSLSKPPINIKASTVTEMQNLECLPVKGTKTQTPNKVVETSSMKKIVLKRSVEKKAVPTDTPSSSPVPATLVNKPVMDLPATVHNKEKTSNVSSALKKESHTKTEIIIPSIKTSVGEVVEPNVKKVDEKPSTSVVDVTPSTTKVVVDTTLPISSNPNNADVQPIPKSMKSEDTRLAQPTATQKLDKKQSFDMKKDVSSSETKLDKLQQSDITKKNPDVSAEKKLDDQGKNESSDTISSIGKSINVVKFSNTASNSSDASSYTSPVGKKTSTSVEISPIKPVVKTSMEKQSPEKVDAAASTKIAVVDAKPSVSATKSEIENVNVVSSTAKVSEIRSPKKILSLKQDVKTSDKISGGDSKSPQVPATSKPSNDTFRIPAEYQSKKPSSASVSSINEKPVFNINEVIVNATSGIPSNVNKSRVISLTEILSTSEKVPLSATKGGISKPAHKLPVAFKESSAVTIDVKKQNIPKSKGIADVVVNKLSTNTNVPNVDKIDTLKTNKSSIKDTVVEDKIVTNIKIGKAEADATAKPLTPSADASVKVPAAPAIAIEPSGSSINKPVVDTKPPATPVLSKDKHVTETKQPVNVIPSKDNKLSVEAVTLVESSDKVKASKEIKNVLVEPISTKDTVSVEKKDSADELKPAVTVEATTKSDSSKDKSLVDTKYSTESVLSKDKSLVDIKRPVKSVLSKEELPTRTKKPVEPVVSINTSLADTKDIPAVSTPAIPVEVQKKSGVVGKKSDSFKDKNSDILDKKSDILAKKSDTLAKKSDTLDKKSDTLAKKSDTLAKKSDTLDKKSDTLDKKSDVLDKKSDIMAKKSDRLDKKTDTLDKESDVLDKKSDILTKKSDILAKKSDTLDKKSDVLDKKSDIMAKKSDRLDKKTDTLDKEADVLDKKSDILAKKSDTLDKKSDILAKKSGTLDKKSDILAKKSGTLDKKSDVLVKKSDVLNKKSDILDKKSEICDNKQDILVKKSDSSKDKLPVEIKHLPKINIPKDKLSARVTLIKDKSLDPTKESAVVSKNETEVKEKSTVEPKNKPSGAKVEVETLLSKNEVTEKVEDQYVADALQAKEKESSSKFVLASEKVSIKTKSLIVLVTPHTSIETKVIDKESTKSPSAIPTDDSTTNRRTTRRTRSNTFDKSESSIDNKNKKSVNNKVTTVIKKIESSTRKGKKSINEKNEVENEATKGEKIEEIEKPQKSDDTDAETPKGKGKQKKKALKENENDKEEKNVDNRKVNEPQVVGDTNRELRHRKVAETNKNKTPILNENEEKKPRGRGRPKGKASTVAVCKEDDKSIPTFTRSQAQLVKDKEGAIKADSSKENLEKNDVVDDLGDIEEQIVKTEIRPSKKLRLSDSSVEITVIDKSKKTITVSTSEKGKESEKIVPSGEKPEPIKTRRSLRSSQLANTDNAGKGVKDQGKVSNEPKVLETDKNEKISDNSENRELKLADEPLCVQKKVPLLTCIDISKLKAPPETTSEASIPDINENKPIDSDSDGSFGAGDIGIDADGDSSDDAVVILPENDPLACSDEDTNEPAHPPITMATFKLDTDDATPTTPLARVTRKRAAQQSVDALRDTRVQKKKTQLEKKEEVDSKKPKLKKRSVDRNLRRSIEEQKLKTVSSSEEEEGDNNDAKIKSDLLPKQDSGKKSKSIAKRRISTRSTRATESPVPSSDPLSEASRTDASNTPPVVKEKKPRKTKKTLLGLEISEAAETLLKGESQATVRQSRRIAQIKIKEEAERRKLEEVTLQELKDEQRKRKGKKSEDKDYKIEKRKRNKNLPTEDETTCDAESDEKKKRKRKRKHWDPTKKFDLFKAWKSSSGSSSSEVEDEEEEIEEDDDHQLVVKSDHEFSPESDLEEGAEVQPLKRARTARKESDAEEVDDCACQKCGQKDHPEWILLCDSCDCGWHCSCLRPALLVIPEGDWFCPPCQHITLVKNLEERLHEYDRKINKKEMETRRKERLAYVGISLDNVLPSKETDEHRQKQRQQQEKESGKDEESGESGSDESNSNSESCSSSDSDSDEPVYQLRERRQAHSYRFNDYDELINSAIQDELEAVKGAGNQGRGKDIATIVNAEKEEAEAQRLKSETVAGTDVVPPSDAAVATASTDSLVPASVEAVDALAAPANPTLEPLPPVVPPNYDAKTADDSDGEIIRPVKKIIGKKKHRKLNCLDVSSDDDAESDEDFKGSSSSESEEDFDEDDYTGSESSDADTRRGKRRKDIGPVRRSTRARISRYDRDFVNDSDSEEEEAPRRKKTRSVWDESESEESDRSWGRRKRKAAKSRRRKSSAKAKKSKKKKKKRRTGDDSDPEVYRKKPNIKFGGLNDDEEVGRRTRGKKINYLEALGTDSEEEIRRKPPRIEESEEEYNLHEDEDFKQQLGNDKDSDESGVDTVLQDIAKNTQPRPKARGRGKSGLKIPRKPKDAPPPEFSSLMPDLSQPIMEPPLSIMDPTVLQPLQSLQPLQPMQSLMEQPSMLAPSMLIPSMLAPSMVQESDLQDPEDEPNPIEQINKNVEQMNEQEMEKMMEEEDYANKQLQLVALQIEKEKKRKEREAKRLEKLMEKEQKIPKKRGRKPKNQMLGANADLVPPYSESASMMMNSVMANNAELSEPPGVSLPMFSEIAPVLNADGTPKKRRGRGKGKKTLAAEAAAIAAANKDNPELEMGLEASSGSNTVSPAPDSPMHGTKLGIAAPPQPFSQSQPTPSVITRMLQSQPGQGSFPGGGTKYFGGLTGDPQLGPPPGSGSYHPGASGPRGPMPGPYQQPPPGMPHYPVVRSGPAPPHRLHSPGPPGLPPMYHTHRSMDPSPSGGGPINVSTTNRDRHSPAIVSPSSSSPLSKGDPTPPPPPYTRPQVGHFAPGVVSSAAATGPRHVSMVPPHLQQHRGSNMSPYHPGVPPNYHYGSYPPPPPLNTDEGQSPPVYPNPAYSEPYPTEGGAPVQPSEGGSNKAFDEDTGGEFVGLVSYFSSQREDDLDT